jgi:ABC-2 type transport system ATP-binding protein
MLLFEDYRKQFGDTTIISIPRLELPHGIYWLKGENGAGKTTLFKSISGLIPYDGQITLSGHNIRTNRIAYTKSVNYAEAEPVYPGFLTGTDLVDFYAQTKTAPDKQVAQLTDTLGIAGYAGNKTATYSSGMSKKLSLVLAFIGSPALILLDEPLITLDQQSVLALLQLIHSYHSRGISFLITSHQEIDLGTIKPTRLEIKNKTMSLL